MSDERLRAALRKARETGEWMPYLVCAQRAGSRLEDVLLETQGAAIPLIQKHASDLAKFYQDVKLKVAEWMLQAEELPCESPNQQLKNDILVWTYAVLEMPQKAREFLPHIWYNDKSKGLEKLADSPNDFDARRLNPITDMTVMDHSKSEAEKVSELTHKLKSGEMEEAETFAAKLPPRHRFRAYIDFSRILKNKDYEHE